MIFLPIKTRSQLGYPKFFIGLIFWTIFAFTIPFVGSGVNHLGVLIFGGKNGFFNTFKPLTYAMVIGGVYGVINATILTILSILNIKNLVLNLVITMIILLIGFIHTLYAEVIGISQYQDMSKGKALLAILVSIVIAMVAFFVLFFGLVLLGVFLTKRI